MTDVVVLQRFIPSYRVAVFEEIANIASFKVTYIIGENIEGLKAQNSKDLSNLNYIKLKSKGLNFFGRTIIWHFGLLKTLIKIKPKVIVCEAESHILGYLIAIFYKILLLGNPRLIQWCFYVLPGRENERGPVELKIRKIIRSFFSGFISYAEMGKTYLIKQGINPSNIFVAHNVCDTKKFLNKASSLAITRKEAKNILNLNKKFIVSFIGTLDRAKRPDFIFELAKNLIDDNIHFLIIGDGPLKTGLQDDLQNSNLKNVSITGKISDDISLYYKATDLTILPGRGGIVISESMCFSRPVIAFQADGTELDLIINGHTGIILPTDDINLFRRSIKDLSIDEVRCEQMGINAHNLILSKMNTKNMALAVIQAINSQI